jgi:hypothetical protein
LNPKLTLLVSIITFFVVSTILGLVLSFFGLESYSYRGGEQNTTFVGWFTVLTGLIVAIRLHWYLRGDSKANINFSNKLGLKYFLYGSIAWVVMICLGSLINVQPLFVEQILGVVLTIALIYIFNSNYQSKIAQINHQIKTEKLKKIKEEDKKKPQKEKKKVEIKSKENTTHKSFKVDMEKASQAMKEITPEQWQESIDQLTAERVAQTRRLMNEITYPPNPPLFIWEDVTNYYMDGGRPAVQVRPSDGSICGFVSDSRKPPLKWYKISPLELMHDSREISKESFFEVFFNSKE